MKKLFVLVLVSVIGGAITLGTYKLLIEKEQKVVKPKKDNTFTDERDGQQYKFIKVNDMLWMAENLNFDTEGSFCFDNTLASCDDLGRLYKWSTANTFCPEGWRLPDDEWLLFQGSGDI